MYTLVPGLLLATFLIAQAHLRDGTTHSGLGPSVSNISPENATLSCPQPKLMEAVLQLGIPLTRFIQCEQSPLF